MSAEFYAMVEGDSLPKTNDNDHLSEDGSSDDTINEDESQGNSLQNDRKKVSQLAICPNFHFDR